MSERVLLLDDNFDLATLEQQTWAEYQAVICLFWLAPETSTQLSEAIGSHCYGLADIISDNMTWGKGAYKIVTKVANAGPQYKNLYWRTYLTENLYHEALTLHLLIQIVSFIEQLRKDWSVATVLIEGVFPQTKATLLEALVTDYPGLIYSPLSELSASVERSSRWFRLYKHLKEAYLTGQWSELLWKFITQSDRKYAGRYWLGRWQPKPTISSGEITFFSSYVNNSRTLAAFIDLMPSPVNWLLTTESARRGLPANSQASYTWLWKFAPSAGTTEPMLEPGLFKASSELSIPSQAILEKWLATSPLWHNWQTTQFLGVVKLTQCWEAYLDQAQPRLIVMANQWGIDGWFMRLARQRGIPVLQLLHGVLGGYLHTRTPLLSDAMVVWGDFWLNLWPVKERPRIISYNPGGKFSAIPRQEDNCRRLTFFSWPLVQLLPYYNASELMDGFINIFYDLLTQEWCEITVRAHPLENPDDFRQRWQKVKGALPRGLTLSKHEPLTDILAQTDVALMFRSTVMLNCLVNGIPVLMPGWIDFGWNEALTDVTSVYVAPDFHHLEKQLKVWLEQPPPADEKVAEYFIKSPRGEHSEFCAFVANWVHRK